MRQPRANPARNRQDAGAHDAQHIPPFALDLAADHMAIIDARFAPRIGRQMRLDLRKLRFRQPKLVATHLCLLFGSRESRHYVRANTFMGPDPRYRRRLLEATWSPAISILFDNQRPCGTIACPFSIGAGCCQALSDSSPSIQW